MKETTAVADVQENKWNVGPPLKAGKKLSLLEEIAAMRQLFGELPTGEDTQVLENHFDYLESLVKSNHDVIIDSLPDELPCNVEPGSGTTLVPLARHQSKKKSSKRASQESLSVQRVLERKRSTDPFDCSVR